jgi:hypothetical protein
MFRSLPELYRPTEHAPAATTVREREAPVRPAASIAPAQRPPARSAGALLVEATRYFERHVLAWYALGRVSEARSARKAIEHHRQALAGESRKFPPA